MWLKDFFKKRSYFKRNYSIMYDEANMIYDRFCKLCRTYVVDEDNVEEFNNKKNAIVYYTKHLKNKLHLFEVEIKYSYELDSNTRKKRQRIWSIIEEITSMCG